MNILLVDNHDLILDSILLLIQDIVPEAKVFKAFNGNDAFNIAKLHKPDLVISDYKMEGLNGHELLGAIKNENITTRFLIISMVSEYAVINALINQGVDGYINKECDKWEISKGIKLVLQGKQYLCSSTRHILNDYKFNDSKSPYLSKREVEILRHIYAEKKNQEIATILNISVSTVETHKKNLIKKLKVKTSVGLIKYVAENNIIDKL
jgi:DNA-binding NarL/FixJ family response regulator